MKPKGMEVIAIETEAFSRMMEEITEMLKTAIIEAHRHARDETNPVSDWLTKDVAMKLLGIKKSKLQQLRDKEEIIFSQKTGGKIILYSRKSILNYLEKNKL